MSETPPQIRLKALWVFLCFASIFLIGRAQAQTVTLEWNSSPSTTVAGYIVAYGINTNALDEQVDVGDTNAATISGLSAGATYYFEVLAYDTNHQESPPCAPISYTIPIISWTIATLTSPNGGGTVTGGGAYVDGTQVTVTATAASGFQFVDWTENGTNVSESLDYSFVVGTNEDLVANFSPIDFTVTGSAGANGNIGPVGAQTVAMGGSLAFGATPASGYQVGQWLVNGIAEQNGGTTFTLSDVIANNTVAVSFVALPTVAVSASPSAGGIVTGAGTYASGSSVTVVTVANSGYSFTNWTENGLVQSAAPAYNFVLTQSRNLVANFTRNQVNYTVTGSAGGNGAISPGSPTSVASGGSMTFVALPSSGYQVNQWLVGGVVAQSGGSSFTLSNVSSNTTVSVTFTAEPTVTVAANPATAGIVTGGGSYAIGSSVTAVAIANSGYSFTNWTENGIVQSSSPAYTFAVTQNRNLVANFAQSQVNYTVSGSAETNGAISPFGSVPVASGGSMTFTATPAGGYQVNQWLIGGVLAQAGSASFTLTNVSSNATVAVTFSSEPVVAVRASPTNDGTVTGGGAYAAGSSVTVVASANEGYSFTNWTEDGVVQSDSPAYNFVLTQNRNLVANFTQNQINYVITGSAGANGAVSPSGAISMAPGGSMTFIALPSSGYEVNQWFVGGVAEQNGGSSFALSDVSSNTAVSVTFSLEPVVAVAASPAVAGDVTGEGSYASGSSVTAVAIANSGYSFTNWTENGVVQSDSPAYNFVLTQNRNLVANFVQNQVNYTVTAGAGANGSVSPNGSVPVASGGSITFSATPVSGYQVNQWLVGGVAAQSGGNSFTLQTVSANATVSVTFSSEPTVAVAASPANAGTLTGGGAYSTGSSVSVVAGANAGYSFTNWTENGIVQSSSPAYTFVLTQNRNLVANFTQNQVNYTIVASAGANGSVSPSGFASIVSGGSTTFVALPASGYQVNQWLVGGVVGQNGGGFFTLAKISSNTTVSVTFNSEPTVTVAANPSTAGIVTGGGSYATGSSVTAVAIANSGYSFTNWTENGIALSFSPAYTFVLTQNRNLTANFARNQVNYTVTGNAGTNGAVSPYGSVPVASGGAITYTATPANGYEVNQWLVGGVVAESGSGSFTLTNVSSNTTISVNFSFEPVVTVTASPTNEGIVTGGGAYATDSSVTVVGVPNIGYSFTNWTENGVVQSESPAYTFTLTQSRNLTANFLQDQVNFTLTGSAGTNGSISPNSPTLVAAGGSMTFVALPASGYQVNQWLVDGVAAQSGGSSFTLANISSNAAVSVTFASEPTVALAASPASAGVVTGAGSYANGSSVTAVAIANSGYSFANWTENGVVQSSSPAYTFVLTQNRSLVANFTQNQVNYIVTAIAGGNGTVTPSGAVPVVSGGSITFAATPSSGYQVYQWQVGGVVAQTGGNSFTLANVSSSAAVSVTFGIEPLVTLSASPADAGTTTGGGTYAAGSSVTVAAVASSGYSFTNWTENGSVQSSSPVFTFALLQNRNLVANFTQNRVNYTITASAGANGSISPSGAISTPPGSSVTLVATPSSGYQVGQWLVGGVIAQTGGESFTLANVSSSAAVSVTFSAEPVVTVAASPNNDGTVTGGGAYVTGSSVTAIAIASSGFSFTNWTENGIVQSSSPAYTFVLTQNRSLVANFARNQVNYTVTGSAGANGAISPSGSVPVSSGGSIAFAGTPSSGYQVNQWLVGGAVAQSGGSSFTLANVSSNSAVSVTFSPEPTVVVTASPTTAGNVTGGGSYAIGASVTTVALANGGYSFTNWTENGVVQSSSPAYAFVLTQNRNLVANFTQNQVNYIVTGSAGANGAISPSGPISMAPGGSMTFVALPTTGYQVNQWLVGGVVAQSGGVSFNLANVSSNTTVSVTFTSEPTVTVAASPATAGIVTGAGSYASGSSVTAVALANSGYSFTNWTENGVVQSSSPAYTFVVTQNRNLVANFAQNQVNYTVTGSAGTNGTISPFGSVPVASGGSMTFAATPASGYQVNQWLVGGVAAQSGSSSFTLANVSSNTAISVTFSAEPVVAVAASPTNGGTVTGGGAYAVGASVTVVASATTGYSFANWTENGVALSDSPAYNFVLTQSRNLVANFTQNQVNYTVTGSAGDNGAVSPDGPTSVAPGDSMTFIALAASGYEVNQWLIGGVVAQSGGNSFSLANVSSNTTVSVTFSAEPAVAVAASPATAGIVAGAGNYPSGSSVTAVAIANSGYSFANWTENGVVQSSSPAYTFVLTQNRNLVANFVQNQVNYTLTAGAGANGTISPNGSVPVASGGSITYAATPSSGYQVGQWLIGGLVAQSGGESFSVTDVSSNTTVSVTFTSEPTVAAAASPVNAGMITGGGAYGMGASVTLAAYANPGYLFTNWTENGVVQSSSSTYNFVLTQSRNLVANFTRNQINYTVTASSDTNGTVSPAGTTNVASGSALTFNATPVSGYQVSQWLVGGVAAQSGGNSFTLATVMSNTTVSVTFDDLPTVTLTGNPANTGTLNGEGSYAVGSWVTAYATANSGFTFLNWTENGVIQSASATYDFVLTQSRNLVANFAKNKANYSVMASAGNNGAVSPPGPLAVASGGSTTLFATPENGFEVDQWFVGGMLAQTGGASFSLANVSSNTTVSVRFSSEPVVTVSVGQAKAGTVAGGGAYATGSSVTVVAGANSGYAFTNWTENGVVVSASPAYNFVLTGNENLVANFATLPVYVIMPTSGGNGSIAPASPQVLPSGSSIAFSATPAQGFAVSQWVVGGVVAQTGGAGFTLAKVTANATVNVTFVSTLTTKDVTNFTVQVAGRGTVSGYRAGQVLKSGKKYSIVAVPEKGSLFADWSSNGVTLVSAATYTFMAESNLLLQATFVTNPFIPVEGLYTGLIYNTNEISEASSGSFVANVASSGAFSAKMMLGGRTYLSSGKFSISGSATVNIPQGKLPPIVLQLQLGFDTRTIVGVVTGNGWVATLGAQPEIYSAINRAPEAGRYTMVFPGATNESDLPSGNGFASVTVSAYGQIALSGVLGDGTPVSASSVVGAGGVWPLYVQLYGGEGAIFGWLTFTSSGEIDGNVAWIKLPQYRAKYYAAGFSLITQVVGSPYEVEKDVAPFNITSDSISLSGGDLAQGFSAQLGEAALLQGIRGGLDQISFSAATGIFHVTVLDTSTNQKLVIGGAVLQHQNYGAGLFLGQSHTGGAILTPGE